MTFSDDPRSYLTAFGVCRLLGCSRALVYKLVRNKILACYRFGSALRFKRSDVDEYLRRSRQEEMPQTTTARS